MPATVVIEPLNQYLNPANPELYAQARAVVANASTSRDVVDGLRASDGSLGRGDVRADVDGVNAARNVLGALPRALDLALLAAVRSGLGRSIAVFIDKWDRTDGDIGVRITEEAYEGATRVRIVVSHPNDA